MEDPPPQPEERSASTHSRSRRIQCRGSSLPAPASLSSSYFWLLLFGPADLPGGGRRVGVVMCNTHLNRRHEFESPTSVEPVKATLSMSMWLAIAAPAVGPKPGTMFTTPAGKPACDARVRVSARKALLSASANSRVVRGLRPDHVLDQRSHAPTFQPL